MVCVASADKVILVGIDTYKNLPTATLDACENDIKLMKQSLMRFGFNDTPEELTYLPSSLATKENILGALDHAIISMRPGERFVYYQSSHGGPGPDGSARLLTYSSDGSFNGDISSAELKQRIDAARAKSGSVTIILDACFSGGALSKGAGRGAVSKGGRRKVFIRPRSKQNSDGPYIGARFAERFGGQTTITTGGSAFHQFASSKSTEVSWTGTFAGTRQSVFTKYLADALAAAPRGGGSWSEAQAAISPQVSEWSKDEQHPVYAGPGGGPLFSEGTTPSPDPIVVPGGMLGMFNFDNVNAEAVTLSLTVNGSPVTLDTRVKMKTTPLGEKDPNATTVRLNATAHQDGWLFLVDRDASDMVALQHPEEVSTESQILEGAKVSSGKKLDFDLQFNEVGPDRIKAILITDEATAKEFAKLAAENGLGKGKGKPRTGTKTGERFNVTRASFYTADYTVNVSR